MNKLIAIFTSLKGKITLVFAGIFAVSVALIGIATYANVSELYARQIAAENVTATIQAASYIRLHAKSFVNQYLRGYADQLKSMALYFDRKESSVKKSLNAFAEYAQNASTQKPSPNGFIMVTDLDAKVLFGPANAVARFSGAEFVKGYIKTQGQNYQFFARNPYDGVPEIFSSAVVSMKEWNTLIWVCVPERDTIGKDAVAGIKEYLSALNKEKTGAFFLLDLNGNIVYHPVEKDNVAVNKSGGLYYMKTFYDSLGKIVEEKRTLLNDKKNLSFVSIPEWETELQIAFPVTEWKNFPGEETDVNKRVPKYASWIYLPEIDAVLFNAIPTSEMGKHLGIVINKVIYIIIACILAVLVISFLWIRKLLTPIDHVHSLTQSVAQGNFEKKILLEGHDELALLGEQVNKIIDIFRMNAQKFKTAAVRMDQAVQELSSSSQQLSATSQQQAATIREILSSMEDAESLTTSISRRIAAVTVSASENKTAVDEGFNFLKEHLRSFSQIQSSETANMEDLKNLVEKINVIWEIIDVINTVADQSKIIAFNSELEALAAGDAGRNFLIVAAEIRRLADNTLGSISEIKKKITEIQHSADHVMETSKANINDIVNASVGASKLEGVFSGIRDSSAKTLDSSEQIATSARQQAEGFSQILLTIKQISGGIENIAATAKLGNKTASSMKELSDDLVKVTAMYRLQQDTTDEK